MKNLLVLILIFISFPVFSGDYIRDKEQNSLIWDNDPNNETFASWVGNIDDNGFATGFGLIKWYENNMFQVGYFGTMHAGRLNGFVKSFDLKGNYKQGHWTDGKRESDWKLIREKNLKKLAQADIDNMSKILDSSPKVKEESTSDNKLDSLHYEDLTTSFFKGMSKEASEQLGVETAKLISNIFKSEPKSND